MVGAVVAAEVAAVNGVVPLAALLCLTCMWSGRARSLPFAVLPTFTRPTAGSSKTVPPLPYPLPPHLLRPHPPPFAHAPLPPPRRRRTGFEDSKEFPIRRNDLIAGRYQVGGGGGTEIQGRDGVWRGGKGMGSPASIPAVQALSSLAPLHASIPPPSPPLSPSPSPADPQVVRLPGQCRIRPGRAGAVLPLTLSLHQPPFFPSHPHTLPPVLLPGDGLPGQCSLQPGRVFPLLSFLPPSMLYEHPPPPGHPAPLIPPPPQVMDFLGSAAFSQAVQALDVATGGLVCLKIIKNNKDYFDQSLDEIKLLR